MSSACVKCWWIELLFLFTLFRLQLPLLRLGVLDTIKISGRIPMIVHQSWRDDGFPKDMFNFRWQQAILALNPGWKLMRWTDETSRQLIAEDFPWLLAQLTRTLAITPAPP